MLCCHEFRDSRHGAGLAEPAVGTAASTRVQSSTGTFTSEVRNGLTVCRSERCPWGIRRSGTAGEELRPTCRKWPWCLGAQPPDDHWRRLVESVARGR